MSLTLILLVALVLLLAGFNLWQWLRNRALQSSVAALEAQLDAYKGEKKKREAYVSELINRQQALGEWVRWANFMHHNVFACSDLGSWAKMTPTLIQAVQRKVDEGKKATDFLKAIQQKIDESRQPTA